MDHQHAAVTMTGDVQRVRHAGQGRHVHQNVGKPLFAVVQHFGEVRALQQDSGIDDGGGHRDYVAVGDIGLIAEPKRSMASARRAQNASIPSRWA